MSGDYSAGDDVVVAAAYTLQKNTVLRVMIAKTCIITRCLTALGPARRGNVRKLGLVVRWSNSHIVTLCAAFQRGFTCTVKRITRQFRSMVVGTYIHERTPGEISIAISSLDASSCKIAECWNSGPQQWFPSWTMMGKPCNWLGWRTVNAVELLVKRLPRTFDAYKAWKHWDMISAFHWRQDWHKFHQSELPLRNCSTSRLKPVVK